MNKIITLFALVFLFSMQVFAQKSDKTKRKEAKKIKQERFAENQYTEEDGINYLNYLYTTFNRTSKLTFNQQLAEIRKMIKNGCHF